MKETITQIHGLTPDELTNEILKVIVEYFNQCQPQQTQSSDKELLTRKEVAKLLKVSIPTIIEWDRKKILNPHRIGNLIRYKKSEVIDAMTIINH